MSILLRRFGAMHARRHRLVSLKVGLCLRGDVLGLLQLALETLLLGLHGRRDARPAEPLVLRLDLPRIQ